MATKNGRYTPTEQAILDILSDGLPHLRTELHTCLPDDLGALRNVQQHLSNIRKKLPQGQSVLCVVVNRRYAYRLVRLLNSPYDGRS